MLAQNKVNHNRPSDDRGPTPLEDACYNCHEGMMKQLLARNHVDYKKVNDKGRTPLWKTAYNGHRRVVKVLLPGTKSNPSQTTIVIHHSGTLL